MSNPKPLATCNQFFQKFTKLYNHLAKELLPKTQLRVQNELIWNPILLTNLITARQRMMMTVTHFLVTMMVSGNALRYHGLHISMSSQAAPLNLTYLPLYISNISPHIAPRHQKHHRSNSPQPHHQAQS